MGFINKIKRLVRNLIGSKEDITNLSVSSNALKSSIGLWNDVFNDRSPWLRGRNLKSFGMASILVEEVARLTLLEFNYIGSGGDNENNKTQKIDEAIGGLISSGLGANSSRIYNALEGAMIDGGFFLKPFIDNNGDIKIDLISQRDAIVINSNDDGVITACAFPDFKFIGDKVYTRLEMHELDESTNTLVITNRAFESESAERPYEREIALGSVAEWEDVSPEVVINNVKRPLYGYFRTPKRNVNDRFSPLGVAIFANALSLIEQIDEQYNRLIAEYALSETAVFVDASAFETKVTKGADGKPKKETVLPKGQERIYRVLKESSSINEQRLFEVFSPNIRNREIEEGLNKLIEQLENKVGLSKGTISDVDSGGANYANELNLKLKRNKTEHLIRRCQENLTDAFEGLIVAIDELIDIYGLSGAGDVDYDVEHISFGDGVITDDKTRLEEMRQDVLEGLIPRWMYVMEKYGVTEQEAKALGVEANPNPLDGLYDN